MEAGKFTLGTFVKQIRCSLSFVNVPQPPTPYTRGLYSLNVGRLARLVAAACMWDSCSWGRRVGFVDAGRVLPDFDCLDERHAPAFGAVQFVHGRRRGPGAGVGAVGGGAFALPSRGAGHRGHGWRQVFTFVWALVELGSAWATAGRVHQVRMSVRGRA